MHEYFLGNYRITGISNGILILVALLMSTQSCGSSNNNIAGYWIVNMD